MAEEPSPACCRQVRRRGARQRPPVDGSWFVDLLSSLPSTAAHLRRPEPVSRPSPSGGLRPALTRAPGGANGQRARAATKEDQQTKIRLPQVSGKHNDAELAYNTLAMALCHRPTSSKAMSPRQGASPNAHGEPGRASISAVGIS